MTIKSVGLPKSQRFCISRAELKDTFGDVEPLNVYMGSLSPRFMFDPRCYHRPKLKGPVVASLGVSREKTAILQVYGVPCDAYPDGGVQLFKMKVLPRMREWLLSQLSKPETAIRGYEELVIEWVGTGHREHSLRLL